MSFSFSVQVASKDDVEAAVEAKLAEVVKSQPIHEHDSDTVRFAAGSVVASLAEPKEDEHISLSVSGSLGWQGSQDEPRFTSANISAQASLLKKPAE